MKEIVWIYPGSFDPITYGHIDVIRRSSSLCGRLIVAVLNNKEKSPLFSPDERVNMIEKAVAGMDNVSVKSYDGLLADFYRQEHADAVVRGIRNQTDYRYELRDARVNEMLCPGYETVLLFNDSRYSVVSSGIVKEIASYGGELSEFVPQFIEARLKEKYKENYS